MITFTDKLISQIRKKNSLLCIGLDPQLKLLPKHLIKEARLYHLPTHAAVETAIRNFNRSLIDATAEYAIAYKPQSAFYEMYGSWGMGALEDTIDYLREKNLPVILDGKRGDGGDTARAYAETYIGEIPRLAYKEEDEFDIGDSPLRSDAVTIHGYIGDACVLPFVAEMKKHGTGAFIVDKTSFKPNSRVEQLVTTDNIPVWQALAHMLADWSDGTEGIEGYRNLGVVMGATYPQDTPIMRKILPKSWFLVPGYGAQGGGANDAVIGVNPDGFGCVVNSSRGIIYASNGEDFAEAAAKAAKKSRDDLNEALERRLSTH
jgi:orotidine-5'-phosphate decarboxylase